MSLTSLLFANPSVKFRPIIGSPGYLIGSDGFVRSCRTTKSIGSNWKVLKGGKNWAGYRQLLIRRFGVYKMVKVHHLVLEAFKGPRPPGMEARHLDGNRTNNNASNLEWASHETNILDKKKHGTQPRGSKVSNAKINESTAAKVKKMLRSGIGSTAIGRMLGINTSTVERIKYKKTWLHVN